MAWPRRKYALFFGSSRSLCVQSMCMCIHMCVCGVCLFVCWKTLLFNSSQLSSSTSTVKSAKHANNSNGKNIFNQLTVKVYGNTSPRAEREKKRECETEKNKRITAWKIKFLRMRLTESRITYVKRFLDFHTASQTEP